MTATRQPDLISDPEYFDTGFYAPRCEKCGRFIAYEHANHWGYCPRCQDLRDPEWRTRPPYEGLYCIYCGQETGSNTDMCVPCALRELGARRSDEYDTQAIAGVYYLDGDEHYGTDQY